MPDWDENSPRLQHNLERALRSARDDALARRHITLLRLRIWHRLTLLGLSSPNPLYAGQFRGEAGLEDMGVKIGASEGTPPYQVANELAVFEENLNKLLSELDLNLPSGAELTADALKAALDTAAWAHAEWVRIHPFANGNGRTARILANTILMRYGIPPVVRLRPRPDGAYGAACADAMGGHWQGLAKVFLEMLKSYGTGP